jgi:peptide chain release factor 1
MNTSMLEKLGGLEERLAELDGLLADPVVLAEQDRFRALSREYAEIQPVVECFRAWRANLRQRAETTTLLAEGDAELRILAEEEISASEAEGERLEAELQRLLLPRDPADDGNVYVEIRAGTGGEEAALFAADLLRMYLRYAEARRWRTETVSESGSEQGGYREVVVRVIGRGAYSRLKFESGGHRVQRVPATEAQGRIHTSACTVAVLPEVDEVEDLPLDASELRIDTYRASGAGGQHVNKTDSAIRITHLPSGLVVECQDERSQHKNRARAMALLRAKLLDAERRRQVAERAETRRLLVGSGDRSQRIRTYNFPQGRVTDHRINLTTHRLEEILDGDLDTLIDPLMSEHQAEQLAALGA